MGQFENTLVEVTVGFNGRKCPFFAVCIRNVKRVGLHATVSACRWDAFVIVFLATSN
jgi:hypothetical protein